MTTPQPASLHGGHTSTTPATSHRVPRSFALRSATAAQDAFFPAPPRIDNGDEARYDDKCGTYTKGVRQSGIGRVDLDAYKTFKHALETGYPDDFDAILLGGPRKLNGPQGGLAFNLNCLENSQFAAPPAPAVASEAYATELVELYWAALLRDVAFSGYASNAVAVQAAAELSSMPSYAGPRQAGQVTPDLLFRGAFPGNSMGPYMSQLALRNTALGALPMVQKYTTAKSNIDFMLDPLTFQQVQNGISTGVELQPDAPVYLHDGRGLGAYTRVDVLYQAYFTAYLVLNALNAPLNPGNPYHSSKTQNGFGTFGQPDIAAALAAVARESLKAVWYHKWFVHLRHRPESGGALVYLSNTGQGGSLAARLSPTVLNSQAVETSFTTNNSYFLSQAFPEGSPTHPAYPTGHGAVAGACITVLKFFFDGNFVIPDPVAPTDDGTTLIPYTGADASQINVNGELNKLAHNISFGHGIHAGIHWRSDTDTSIVLGEAVALSCLRDLALTYNEKFTIQLTKLDGAVATIGNQ